MFHKRNLTRSAVAVLALTGMSTARIAKEGRATPYTLLAGGYTNVITTLSFDPAGKISVVGSADSGTNPSWLATHPTVKTVTYAANEYDGGFISSFTTTSPSRLVKKVNSASALGDAPCHLAVVRGGTEVLAADYNSGTVAAYGLSADKLTFTGGQKIGPFPSASNISHPHQVVEYGKEIFIPDLGADKIWRLTKGYTGWSVAGFIGQPAGSGPRHIATRGNIVFVLHELANTLASQFITFAPTDSINPPTFSTVSVLPPAIPGQVTPGRFHAAELILSLDGQYLYASNRDTSATPDPRGDAIAIVRVGANGSLTVVKHVFTGLQLLRGLSLSPDGKYLIGGGQAAGGLAAWAIVSGGADLKEVARNSAGPAATGFTWL